MQLQRCRGNSSGVWCAKGKKPNEVGGTNNTSVHLVDCCCWFLPFLYANLFFYCFCNLANEAYAYFIVVVGNIFESIGSIFFLTAHSLFRALKSDGGMWVFTRVVFISYISIFLSRTRWILWSLMTEITLRNLFLIYLKLYFFVGY